MANSNIHWTTKVWNFIAGCSLESPGCEHCYAMRMAWRLMHIPMMKGKYKGTARKTAGGKIQWTGQINFDLEALLLPLKWKKPTTIFVNSMSDLFHPSIPFDFVDRVFCIMRAADWHTYQVLTKRADRMRDYLTSPALPARLDACYMDMLNEGIPLGSKVCIMQEQGPDRKYWPMPNVHLGVSIESQKYLDRLYALAEIPAIVRFLSLEPLLGPIDLFQSPNTGFYTTEYINKIHWIIVGGESGAGARPMQKIWVEQIRDVCQAARIKFFFKQWGEWHPWGEKMLDGNVNLISKGKRAGFYIDEGPMSRIGRARSGNLLDGRQWLQMPK